MFRSNVSYFNKSVELSESEIMRRAPSVFATAPSDSTSDKYLFIPTIEIVRAMIKEGYAVTHASQSRCKDIDGQDKVKHMLRYRKKDAVTGELAKFADGLSTEIVQINSHNGLTANSFNLGAFRQVCSNGMIAFDLLAKESVTHRDYNIDRVIEAQYRILENEPKLIESIQTMKAVTLSTDEKRAFATAAIATKWDEEQTKPAIESLLRARRMGDQGSDLWTTFNVIQENMIRGGLRTQSVDVNGQTRRNSTREVTAVGENKRLNQALWTLADEMKKLKSYSVA